jgi:hypothetical protein
LSHPRCEPGFLDSAIFHGGYCTNPDDRSKFLQELDTSTMPAAESSGTICRRVNDSSAGLKSPDEVLGVITFDDEWVATHETGDDAENLRLSLAALIVELHQLIRLRIENAE